MKVNLREQDRSARFKFCGKLLRGLAGDRSYLFRADDKNQTPLDPSVFWEEVCLAIVGFVN